jgi:PAS domain S-box-containing protein
MSLPLHNSRIFAPSAKSAASAKWMLFSALLVLLFVALPCAAYAQGVEDFLARDLFDKDILSNASLALAFTGDATFASLIFGLFMGAMLTASAYLFFIWIVMRDRGQVFLLLLLVCLSANVASTNDLLMAQLGLTGTAARELLANYSMIFSYIFSTIFTYYFLEVDINAPLLRWPLALLSLILLGLLVYSIFNRALMHFMLAPLGTLTIASVLAVGAVSFYRGVSGSLTHITAFFFFLIGLLAGPLYDLGYLVNTTIADNLTYICFSLSALMFAIVTASQFAARQEEKEKALAISNERFTLATRGANEGLFDWDLVTGQVFFSDQFKKIVGLRLENKPDGLKRWMRLMVPDDRRIVRAALRRFRHNPNINSINFEYRIVQANDVRRWLHSKTVAMRDPVTKRIIRLVGSTSDITARKQSEVALRESETRFRSITEAHPVPVMIVSLTHGIVLYTSPSAEQLLGLSQNQLVHQAFDRFLTDVAARDDIWNTMTTGKEMNLKEVKLIRGDQTFLDAALSARRISYQNEDAMVIGLYDLTERKEAEAQIARQQEALQQSEKMAALGGLLAGVAHELNNPLSVVVGQATLLMEGSQEPKVVTRADKIFKAADRCARIVKSFLALARRKPPERKAMDLNTLINGSLELLGYQLRTGGIEVTLDLQAKLPEVSGDSDQMTQVITNLVLNAAQALERSSKQRRITICTSGDDKGHVIIRVADNGPGVPPEIRSKIFEPFFTTRAGTGGTGVGLSLCLNIVASHGGQLTVEDTPGGGATFTATLPTATAAQDPAAAPVEEDGVRLPKLGILLVDDEVELAQTLADLLEQEGHHIDIAANGAIALEKLHKGPYDLIISDLRMPVMDGPGLYEAMSRELPSYLPKIIYVTGDTLSTHVQAFLKQYPVPVVEKPYRLVDVRRVMDDVLKKNIANADKKPETPLASSA